MFVPLLIISPAIFIIIKLLAIFKSGNTLLQIQATYGSRGEGILEAAPQLSLQLYIVLLSLKPTQNQVLSILTSAATISLPNIENFVSSRGGEFGFKPITKNIWVFLPASLFKILSVSLLAVFLRGWVILLIVAIIILVFVFLWQSGNRYYNLPGKVGDDGQAWQQLDGSQGMGVRIAELAHIGRARDQQGDCCLLISLHPHRHHHLQPHSGHYNANLQRGH